MIPNDDLVNRFTYHAPSKDQGERYSTIRSLALEYAEVINELCPDSREKSLAITHMEEAVMWANAAIARHSSTENNLQDRSNT